MTEAQVMEAMLSIASLAIVWFLVSSAWPSYRLAAFRQDLFDVRDALFDVAMANPDLFKHESYRLLRNRINITIRFAHKFTTTRLIITMILLKKKRISVTEDWLLTLRELPKGLQASLGGVHRMMVIRIGCHMLCVPMWFMRTVERVASTAQKEIAKREIAAKVEMMEAQAVEEVVQEQELALAASRA